MKDANDVVKNNTLFMPYIMQLEYCADINIHYIQNYIVQEIIK